MKVNIGVTKYEMTVVNADKLWEAFGQEEDGTILGGFLCPMMNEIVLNKELPEQGRIQTFFHECTHAMLDEIGEGELFHDEDFVNSMSKQIYGFFQNNNFEKIYSFLGDKK